MASAARHVAEDDSTRAESRRTEQRYRVNLAVELSAAETPREIRRARLRDVSRRGMQFLVDGEFSSGPHLRVLWKGHELHGIIRYQQMAGEQCRLGVELLSPWDSLVNEVLACQAEELSAALAMARDLSETKSRFLASVSHELRTPLNGIIGFTQLVHDGGAGPLTYEQKDCLADVLSCSQHLLTLINHVLDLSRVEAGKMTFHYEPVRLPELMASAVESLRTIAAAKQIDVHLEVEPDVAVVQADASRLRQVVLNYLSNALKFTPAQGAVFVQVTAEGEQYYRVEVQDTGIGIQAADLPRLFQEFGQLASGRMREGTGLGLAITKRIVEAQGGRVGVDSVIGHGSRFYAVLPVAEQN